MNQDVTARLLAEARELPARSEYASLAANLRPDFKESGSHRTVLTRVGHHGLVLGPWSNALIYSTALRRWPKREHRALFQLLARGDLRVLRRSGDGHGVHPASLVPPGSSFYYEIVPAALVSGARDTTFPHPRTRQAVAKGKAHHARGVRFRSRGAVAYAEHEFRDAAKAYALASRLAEREGNAHKAEVYRRLAARTEAFAAEVRAAASRDKSRKKSRRDTDERSVTNKTPHGALVLRQERRTIEVIEGALSEADLLSLERDSGRFSSPRRKPSKRRARTARGNSPKKRVDNMFGYHHSRRRHRRDADMASDDGFMLVEGDMGGRRRRRRSASYALSPLAPRRRRRRAAGGRFSRRRDYDYSTAHDYRGASEGRDRRRKKTPRKAARKKVSSSARRAAALKGWRTRRAKAKRTTKRKVEPRKARKARKKTRTTRRATRRDRGWYKEPKRHAMAASMGWHNVAKPGWRPEHPKYTGDFYPTRGTTRRGRRYLKQVTKRSGPPGYKAPKRGKKKRGRDYSDYERDHRRRHHRTRRFSRFGYQ